MPKAPFEAKAFCGQEEIKVGEHGYIGRLNPGRVQLRVECPIGRKIFAFVKQRQNVMPVTVRYKPDTDEKYFCANVQVVAQHPSGVWYSRSAGSNSFMPLYPNSIHLADFGSGGEMKIWEVSLVGWKGHFYLKVQLLHTAKLFLDLDRNNVRCPYFEEDAGRRWPQLIEFCQRLMDERKLLLRLQYSSTYQSLPSATLDLASDQALVLFFSWARLFAVLLLPNGNRILLRADQLPLRPRQLPHVKIGEFVRVKKIERLPRLEKRPSTFTHEAVGVSLIR